MEREFYNEKPCAKYCTVACVQQVAMADNWRAPQQPFDLPVKGDGLEQTGPQPVEAEVLSAER
jgi:hypothetical protein